jgi:mRNA interferase RelE/StbE
MKVFFKPSFIKDYKKLPSKIRVEVSRICTNVFPKINNLQKFQEFKIKPIKGVRGYYRIRLRDYRIGFKKTEDNIEFMRVKHRKDIYKHFP